MVRVFNVVLIILLIIAIGTSIYGWFFRDKQIVPVNVYTEAKTDPAIKQVKKQSINVRGLKVYDKREVADKLGIPEPVVADDKKVVLADTAVKVPPYKGETSAVTITDTSTGESSVFIKRKPLPFLGTPNEKEIGGRILQSTSGKLVGHLYGRWTVLRTGDIYWAGYTDLRASEASTELTGGIDISYRW